MLMVPSAVANSRANSTFAFLAEVPPLFEEAPRLPVELAHISPGMSENECRFFRPRGGAVLGPALDQILFGRAPCLAEMDRVVAW
jgi:hypothetical protein